MVLGALERLLRRWHTLSVRSRFAAFGRDSVVEFPARLTEPRLMRIGERVLIREHAWLNAKDDREDGTPTLSIGSGTYIGRFCHINAWREVSIEGNVLIADRVFISDADHNYEDTRVPVMQQGDRFKGSVTLREGCWLGIGVVVMPGVTIGRNAVVAANAVVTSDVPDFSVAGGIPARVIKRLDPSASRAEPTQVS